MRLPMCWHHGGYYHNGYCYSDYRYNGHSCAAPHNAENSVALGKSIPLLTNCLCRIIPLQLILFIKLGIYDVCCVVAQTCM